MAVKVNESDAKMAADFFKELDAGKNAGASPTASVAEGPRACNVKIADAGSYRVGYRRYRGSVNILEDVKAAWADITSRIADKSKEAVLKKFDALGFTLDVIGPDKAFDLVLEMK